MKVIAVCLFLITLNLCSHGQDKEGYDISVSISGLQDSSIYLAYYYGDKQYLKDTVNLDKNGQGTFTGNEALPQGIYMIVLPGKQYFEILVGNDQFYSADCSFPDYFNTLKFKGSDENNNFVAYQRKWVGLQGKAAGINKRLQCNRQNPDSLKILSEKQKTQEELMKSYLREVISDNKGSLLAVLVKAMLPVEQPVISVPPGTSNPDSVRWIKTYLYNKDHFFDNIDLTDERLLRTPILQARLNTFFTNVVIQSADSINKEIDKLIAKVSGDYKIFQFVSVFLFNHFRESEIMGHDAVLVKLADDIYLSLK